jgi:hypothetical protein
MEVNHVGYKHERRQFECCFTESSSHAASTTNAKLTSNRCDEWRGRRRDNIAVAAGYFYAVVANGNRQFDRASGGIVQRAEDFGPSREFDFFRRAGRIEQQSRGNCAC